MSLLEHDAQATTPTPLESPQPQKNAAALQLANPAATVPAGGKRRPFLLGRKKKDDEGVLLGKV